MKWSLEYSVGIRNIDEEHKKLFEIISSIEDSKAISVIEVLKSMVEYSKKHFSSEETYMKKIYYPQLDYHVQLHRQFEEQIIKYLTALKKGDELDLKNIRNFLEKWLINHILKEDKKIGNFIHSR